MSGRCGRLYVTDEVRVGAILHTSSK